ncbi:MAG: ABC transporter permease [Christensenellaceae bacterium]|jgi:ABC-type antimicrobial peptide transport system permease subunit|nr:ABC transporter permease [Christensenellaceae bacterium]
MRNLNSIKLSTFSRLNVNVIRTIIIIFSITIAIGCLVVNSFVSDIVDEANLIMFKNTDDRIVMMNVWNAEIDYANVDDVGTIFSGCEYNFFSRYETGQIRIGQRYYSVGAIEVGKIQDKMTLPSIDQDGATEMTHLIEGRIIMESDIIQQKNAILIHKSVGKFIFGDDSKLLGEKMQLVATSDPDAVYEVVGVLADTPDIQRTMQIMTQSYNFSDRYYKLPIVLSGAKCKRVSDVLLFFEHTISSNTLISMQNSLVYSPYENIFMTNREEEILRKSYSTPYNSSIYDIALNLVTVILSLTSVIIIFLSIKSRATEIAIRKSFGATTYDILAMLLKEIVACILISICYALPISTLIMAAVSAHVSNLLYVTVFPLSFDMFLYPIAVISLAVCILSIIPITIYSKSKIVNCLKVT